MDQNNDETEKQELYKHELQKQELYRLGKFLDLCVEFSKLVATSQVGADLYRYAKVIDGSQLGFNCSSAAAIKKNIDINNFSNIKYRDLLEQLKASNIDFELLIDEKIKLNKYKQEDKE